MLELFLQVFFGYSILKLIYHIVLEGHSVKDTLSAANEAGSTLQYKVVRKKDGV